MKLCLDIGNTHIVGGLFLNDQIKLHFRHATRVDETSDQLGLFLVNLLQFHGFLPDSVQAVAVSSVVPGMDYSLNSACIKYFNCTPFWLKPGVKTGLKILVNNPNELGADRVADAVAAHQQFPNKNVVVVDFGTGTTIDVVTQSNEYLGGAILPGINVSLRALSQAAAKLSTVKIVRPDSALGKTTETQIQSGLYYEQLATVDYLIKKMTQEVGFQERPVVVATGGFAHLFKDEGLFDVIIKDLTLQGLHFIYEMNQ